MTDELGKLIDKTYKPLVKEKRYVMGVPWPIEDIDDKDKASYKDEEGIW